MRGQEAVGGVEHHHVAVHVGGQQFAGGPHPGAGNLPLGVSAEVPGPGKLTEGPQPG